VSRRPVTTLRWRAEPRRADSGDVCIRKVRTDPRLLTVTEDADDGVTVMRRGLGRIRVRGRRGDGVVVTLTVWFAW
jgi:hypothetical protein